MTPFTYLNAINDTKENIMVNDDAEKQYVPFIINRTLSYFTDTVLFANEMNTRHHTDKALQFHFYLNTIRKRKRFSKWVKPDIDRDLDVVKQYYGYSNEKARQVLPLLSPEQIEVMSEKVSKGGRK